MRETKKQEMKLCNNLSLLLANCETMSIEKPTIRMDIREIIKAYERQCIGEAMYLLGALSERFTLSEFIQVHRLMRNIRDELNDHINNKHL